MAKKESKSKQIVNKLVNRYRMVIINEQTFEEQLQFRLSRLNVIIFSVLLLTLIGTLAAALIAFTPIKEYIPGYDSTTIRKTATENYLMTDSLILANQKNIQYLNAIKSALSGEVNFAEPPQINEESAEKAATQEYTTKRIKEDSLLRAIVAQEDKYNVAISNTDKTNFLLFPPAKGLISQAFSPEDKHYAVDIVLEENTPIKSVAEGTVIFAEWTAQTGYVIMVEHPYSLLSIYKHNASLTKEQGDRVVTGEVIATAGNTGEFSTGWHLHFELWMDGYPIDPKNFFDF